MSSMQDKTVLITGATDGIGRITAEMMAKAGATLLLHGRSQEKIQRAIDEIKQATGNDKTFGYQADFASLAQVKALGEQVIAEHPRLDVVINNAGLGPGSRSNPARQVSQDGHELIFQVNYLATALLSLQLMPALHQAKGRLINIASEAQAPLQFEHMMEAIGFPAYAQSKLAVINFSLSLAERVRDLGVTVNALDPGSFLNTRMVKETWGESARSPESGALAHLFLAAAPELEQVTGQFFSELRTAQAHEQAYEKEAQNRLWDFTQSTLGALNSSSNARSQ